MNRWLFKLPLRLRTYFRRSQVERDLEEELGYHIDMQTQQNVERGMSPREARLAALRQFGGLSQRAEECRDARRTGWIEGLWQDLRHARRTLAKTPAFTLVAVLSLALGIGASTALFSVVDSVLFKPLNLDGSEQLVWVVETKNGNEAGGNPQRLHDYQQARSFAAAAGWYTESLVLAGEGEPQRIPTMRYAGPMIDGLGYRIALGRGPSHAEQNEGSTAAVVSHGFWQRRLGGDPAVLGRVVRLDGKAYSVIGVMAPAVDFPERVEVYLPVPAGTSAIPRVAGFLGIAARLREGVPMEQAQAEMDALAPTLARQYPESDGGLQVRLSGLREQVTSDARKPLMVLLAAILALLLLACVNVAGLMLARGLNRQREASIRVALGAGKSRLARLFLAESLVIAAAGCALGVLLAATGVDVLKRLLPSDLPRLAAATIDSRVLGFAVLAGLLCALACGLIPSLQAARSAVASAMKEGGAGSVGGGHGSLRSMLVVSQVAISTVLLVGAVLFSTSLMRMREVPLGFSPDNAVTFAVDFAWGTENSRLVAFANQTVAALANLPGVESAGVVDRLPLGGASQSSPVLVRGLDLEPGLAKRRASWRVASPGYFKAAGIPLLRGEGLQPYRDKGPKVVIVNETFARKYFGSSEPIGREIAMNYRNTSPNATTRWMRIAGAFADVRQVINQPVEPEVFSTWGDQYWPLMAFVVRTPVDAATLAPSLRSVVSSIDPNQVAERIGPLQSQLREATLPSRTSAWLTSSFAAAGLLLAAIGLFALLSAEVARRTQEFGVRLALGAEPGLIRRSALNRGLWHAAAGLAIGTGGALLAARLVKGLLFGVRPHDPRTMLVSALLLLAVAAAACWIPARRAASIDPLRALRHE